jgi:hypothetical protein
MSALFAATFPERTSALILYAARAKWTWAEDYPWARTRAETEARLANVEQFWGTGASVDLYAPSLSNDNDYRQWTAVLERSGASPGSMLALIRMNMDLDVRTVLPAIRVPTLVLHRNGDRVVPVENGRYLARHIPDAQYVELEGIDHLPWAGDVESLIQEIARWLTGVSQVPELDRVLVTVLFTDIVGAPNGWRRSGIVAGESSSPVITPSCGSSWNVFGVARSTQLGTAFWQPSTGRRGLSAPHVRCGMRFARSASRYVLASTRASAR